MWPLLGKINVTYSKSILQVFLATVLLWADSDLKIHTKFVDSNTEVRLYTLNISEISSTSIRAKIGKFWILSCKCLIRSEKKCFLFLVCDKKGEPKEGSFGRWNGAYNARDRAIRRQHWNKLLKLRPLLHAINSWILKTNMKNRLWLYEKFPINCADPLRVLIIGDF